jgi:hypothetical protein
MTLQERLDAQMAEFAELCPDWDLTVVSRSVQLSRMGRGPGTSLYLLTADGMGFEEPLRPDDDVAALLGQVIQ